MYSQLILPHSIVIYCIQLLNSLHEFPQRRVTGVGYYRFTGGYNNTHWLEIPLVVTAGLLLRLLSSFSFHASVLSYSGLGLLSVNSL